MNWRQGLCIGVAKPQTLKSEMECADHAVPPSPLYRPALVLVLFNSITCGICNMALLLEQSSSGLPPGPGKLELSFSLDDPAFASDHFR